MIKAQPVTSFCAGMKRKQDINVQSSFLVPLLFVMAGRLFMSVLNVMESYLLQSYGWE